VYLQDAEQVKYSNTSEQLYDAQIKPKDLLTITVNTYDKEVSAPFNLFMPSPATTTSQVALQPYLVDNEGYIDFPVLGKIEVVGKTKTQLESLIKKKLSAYLTEEPVVNVRFVNYQISVIGEVSRPNSFTIANEKINVFEALALAGDMTIYGRRDNVKLIREHSDGGKEIIILNLNDKNLIHSPYFYLQQNDVLYVEPNKARASSSNVSTSTTLWISATSILISVANLLITIYKLK